ncbi:MAG: helix-turn-helix transcriptional regulator [Actinomycetota bacterium]
MLAHWQALMHSDSMERTRGQNGTATRATLLTVEDLAKHLKVPVATIYRWNHDGSGPPRYRLGRWCRYSLEDVEQWLESRSDDPETGSR